MEITPAQPQPQIQPPAREAAPPPADLQTPALESAATQAPRPAAQTGGQANVSMRFEKDEESGELVLYIVDRESKTVLRTIPPEVLAQLTAGQVLNLTA